MRHAGSWTRWSGCDEIETSAKYELSCNAFEQYPAGIGPANEKTWVIYLAERTMAAAAKEALPGRVRM